MLPVKTSPFVALKCGAVICASESAHMHMRMHAFSMEQLRSAYSDGICTNQQSSVYTC